MWLNPKKDKSFFDKFPIKGITLPANFIFKNNLKGG